MVTGHRIADVARRSGFSPATLRYYEEIGLLPHPARNGSGYRVYDDGTLDRLAFINRAKQLGCTLEEITDLSTAWDGGECGPIQDRLRRVVAGKLVETKSRILELVTLSAELQQAGSALQQHRPEGRCDEQCGCTAAPASTVAPVFLGTSPPTAADQPIACALPADAVSGRLDDWDHLLAYVTSRSEVDGGVRLELDADVPLDDLARVVAAEQNCCQFFAFAVTIDARGIGLEVRAPDDAGPIVQALFGTPA
jgi:DNA-binding transcriptional MerR regulator